MPRTVLVVSFVLALLAAGCTGLSLREPPSSAPPFAVTIPGAQPSPSAPALPEPEVPQAIVTVLHRSDLRSPAALVAALLALQGSSPLLETIGAYVVEDSAAVGVPAVVAWWGEGLYDASGALFAWWAPESTRWQVQPFFVEHHVPPISNARMARDGDAYRMVIFTNTGGSGEQNLLKLYELTEGVWQVVWRPTTEVGWVWAGHVSLRFAGAGIDTVELWHSSWLQEGDPKNQIFREANPDPHRWFVDTWQKQGDRYVLRQSRVEPSAYNTLVEFVYALKTGTHAGRWVTDAAVVPLAYGLDLAALPQVEPPWREDYRDGPLFVDFAGQRITFRFVQRDGQYLIEAIDQVPSPTATPDPMRPPTPPPTPTATPTPMPTPALYPMPFAYPFDTLGDAFGGIRYEEMSPLAAGVPTAHPVPADLCGGTVNVYPCSQMTERYLLSLGMAGVLRQGDRLTFALREGGAVTFTDTRSSESSVALYTYAGYLPDITHHVVRVHYDEGGNELLVNATSGEITVLSGQPVVFPAAQRLAVLVWTAPSAPTVVVQTWRVAESGLVFERAWRIAGLSEAMHPGQPVVTWQNEQAFAIRWPDSPDPAASSITAQLGATGWDFRYHDDPLTRPIVDASLIAYARGYGSEQMGLLDVGQPVYADRNYMFTSMPAELVGQPYFLLANNDTRWTEADYLRFQVTDRAVVYVALDAAAIELPGWMQSGWEKVAAMLGTDDLALQLYRKEYPAGVVVLGGNWMPPAGGIRSHYVVIVAPAAEP